MLVYVTAMDARTKKPKLLALFQNRWKAEVWIANVGFGFSEEVWKVWALSRNSWLPNKLVRWIFQSREEAEAFVKSLRIEERDWKYWLH